jgi:hypothetical protein
MDTPKPIKRHPALLSFSREHHFGLLLVWKIKQGLAFGITADRIARYIIYFFDVDLKAHFTDEEAFLFSRLPVTDALRMQAEAEHKEIYSLVTDIAANTNDEAIIRDFSAKLEKHIRFEERVLFNHLQNNIPSDELAEIEKRTSASGDPDAQWTDVFWIKRP